MPSRLGGDGNAEGQVDLGNEAQYRQQGRQRGRLARYAAHSGATGFGSMNEENVCQKKNGAQRPVVLIPWNVSGLRRLEWGVILRLTHILRSPGIRFCRMGIRTAPFMPVVRFRCGLSGYACCVACQKQPALNSLPVPSAGHRPHSKACAQDGRWYECDMDGSGTNSRLSWHRIGLSIYVIERGGNRYPEEERSC